VNGWRQQCNSRKQVVEQLQRAKLLGFDSYCMQRFGQHWWLCCAPLGARQQQQHDVVLALRQQFSQHQQLLMLLQQQQQLLCVSWDQQQLLVALAVSNDSSGQQQLLLVLRGLAQRSRFAPIVLASTDLPADLQHFEQPFGRACQHFNLAQLKPVKSAQLLSLNQSPSWRRRYQLALASIAAISLITALTWHFWPASTSDQPLPEHTLAMPPLAGAGIDVLLLLREQLQQLELLAGWQLNQLQLNGAQLQVQLAQDYGRYGELQQQLQQQWQVSQSAQQVQLTRTFNLLPGSLQFNQPLLQAQQQLQQQAAELFPQLQWQLGGSGGDSHYRWQDLSFSFTSWYWLELAQLQQLLQVFDVRLLELQLNRQPQPKISVQLRIYQPLRQGDDHDSSLDTSARGE
jgi:hypothetical protein